MPGPDLVDGNARRRRRERHEAGQHRFCRHIMRCVRPRTDIAHGATSCKSYTARSTRMLLRSMAPHMTLMYPPPSATRRSMPAVAPPFPPRPRPAMRRGPNNTPLAAQAHPQRAKTQRLRVLSNRTAKASTIFLPKPTAASTMRYCSAACVRTSYRALATTLQHAARADQHEEEVSE